MESDHSATQLRAIELMLMEIDQRLPDDSMAPKPYEISITEMRDLMRLARGGGARTAVGRKALAEAKGQ